ncbi:hypothetical protein IH981_01245 [Patescibacteria group bacterium]|nr:hypothetical protein [Patescibacteria group bacterium]
MVLLAKLNWKIVLIAPLLLLVFLAIAPKEANASRVYGFTAHKEDLGADVNCPGNKSYIRWLTRQYRSESGASGVSTVVRIHRNSDNAVIASTSGGTATGWLCVDIYNTYYELIVNGGASYHDLHVNIRNLRPSLWDYKKYQIHTHLVPRAWGATANSIAPTSGVWINFDPSFKIRVNHLSGRHSTGLHSILLQVTGPGGGTWQPSKSGTTGTYTIGPRGLGDGWHHWIYALGMNGGTPSPWSSFPTGSPGSTNIAWEGFGIDRQRPLLVTTSYSPSTVYSTKTVKLSARARDQSGLSGLRWIQIRISTNNGVTYGAPIQSGNYGGAFDRTFTITRGPWATGTKVCFQARARDRAKNVSSWGGKKCFTVQKGTDLVVDAPLPNLGDFHVGDTIPSIQIRVTNASTQSAGGFYLEFCKNGTTSYTCNVGWSPRWWISSLGGFASKVRFTSTFQAPDPGVYPTTYRIVARADLDLGVPGRVIEVIERTNNRSLGSFRVIGPPPWFQTKGGDVGSIGRIEPKYPPAVGFSADYLVIQQHGSTIKNFTSFLKWRVWNYSPLNIYPQKDAVTGSIYDTFVKKYKLDTSNTVAGLTAIPPTGGNRVFYINDSLTIPSGGVTYSQDPAVVFVKTNLRFDGNLTINTNTGLIFVVAGQVRISTNVSRVDGVIIFDGDFTVLSRGNSTELALIVNGSVIGGFQGGKFDLRRDFRSGDNKLRPTEKFVFEPKYLWLFRDIIGDTKTVWKEVNP